MDKKHRLLLVILVVLVVVSLGITYALSRPKGGCSQNDKDTGNCVPAGRCTPPGSLEELIVDCDVKDYEHKYR